MSDTKRLKYPDLQGLPPKRIREDPTEEKRICEKNNANKRRSRAALKQRALEIASSEPPPKRPQEPNDVENVENSVQTSNSGNQVSSDAPNTTGPSTSHVPFDDTLIDPILLQQPVAETQHNSPPITTRDVCIMTDSPLVNPYDLAPPSPTLSNLTDIESLDLATPIIASQVHANSPTVTWKSGTTTVLPYIYKDVLIHQNTFFIYTTVTGAPRNESCEKPSLAALCQNKAVVLRQCDQPVADELNLELLEDWDAEQRTKNSTYPQQRGTLEQFIRNIRDQSKIQCILDIPPAQGGLPLFLSSLDSGIVDRWNQSTNDCPIGDQVHPDNFTVRSWGLLAKPGWFTYFHHDSDSGCTFVYGIVGTKQWTVANLKNQDTISQTAFAKAARLLGTFPENREEIAALWDIEVITVRKGDLLSLFYQAGIFSIVTLTICPKNSRHLDHKHGNYLTNQAHSHSLETFQRMVVNLPRLSCRTNPGAYVAAGGDKRKLELESTNRATAITAAIVNHFWINLKTGAKNISYSQSDFRE
ncbi:uncharacterized protein F5891DRAFT_980826 [Suillus fuscotomentosus]|uniref:Uncharacterized protein n=1 Tax=Suillus fuscotomentosus TaxID=1912939 RepID=A0AAD4E7Q8_9AGAM|nr:uncharacterized protein F5891DRAFT_980826 [Suillus fuscotomentosus]KAG1899883.1 hypothetical protein F5891DRAFT_980826 [Suillus fuscotomentosus]